MVIKVFIMLSYQVKRSRPTSSINKSDVEGDEWNWRENENIVNIKQSNETAGIKCSVL